MWSAVVKAVLGWIGRIFVPLVAWKMGRDSVNQKRLEHENEVLKNQRDNNVTDFDAAKRMHDKHRE